MNHPSMKNMDPLKMELIKNAASQTAGKSGNSLAPVLMNIITSANKKGIRFDESEISIILELMKDGKSKAEQDHIDKMVTMVTSMMKTKR